MAYDRAYAPFGEIYAETATTNRSFTGQTQDTVSGLYDFLMRQQSAAQGRWLVPDPAGLAAVDMTNPQTWNRYAYLANNPLNATDPLGLYDLPGCDPDDPDCGICDWCIIFPPIIPCIGCGGHPHPGPSPEPEPQPQPKPQPINFPNEINGLPNGFPTNPWGIAGAIIPTAQCGDITCSPIGNGFGPEWALPICAVQPELCIAGGILISIYVIAEYGPALIQQIKNATHPSIDAEWCDRRQNEEESRCYAKYGYGSKYGNNWQRNACLQRVEWRWNNCLRGLPDPGPPLAKLDDIPVMDSNTQEVAQRSSGAPLPPETRSVHF